MKFTVRSERKKAFVEKKQGRRKRAQLAPIQRLMRQLPKLTLD